jgi:hypothetical protein
MNEAEIQVSHELFAFEQITGAEYCQVKLLALKAQGIFKRAAKGVDNFSALTLLYPRIAAAYSSRPSA